VAPFDAAIFAALPCVFIDFMALTAEAAACAFVRFIVKAATCAFIAIIFIAGFFMIFITFLAGRVKRKDAKSAARARLHIKKLDPKQYGMCTIS